MGSQGAYWGIKITDLTPHTKAWKMRHVGLLFIHIISYSTLLCYLFPGNIGYSVKLFPNKNHKGADYTLPLREVMLANRHISDEEIE